MYTVIAILCSAAAGYFCGIQFGLTGVLLALPIGAILGICGAVLDQR